MSTVRATSLEPDQDSETDQRIFNEPASNDDGELLLPPPCESCGQFARCQAELQACAAFRLYVEGAGIKKCASAPREPTATIYLAIYDSPPGEHRPLVTGVPGFRT